MIAQSRPFGQRYAFVVVGVIFLCLLIAAGLRSAPSVMMLPLDKSFGWGRDTVSIAAAIGIFLYGLTGPFAAALMERPDELPGAPENPRFFNFQNRGIRIETRREGVRTFDLLVNVEI